MEDHGRELPHIPDTAFIPPMTVGAPALQIITACLDEIERYDFECEGGPLSNALPWQRLRRYLSGINQHIVFPQAEGMQVSVDRGSCAGQAFSAVALEMFKAASANGPFHSLHEAMGVLDEEVHEFHLEVYKNPRKHADRKQLAYDELKQVAAVAIRAMVDVAS